MDEPELRLILIGNSIAAASLPALIVIQKSSERVVGPGMI